MSRPDPRPVRKWISLMELDTRKPVQVDASIDPTMLEPALVPETGTPDSQPAPAPAPGSPAENHPLVEMLTIAAPVVATMSSFTLMQFVDKWMVSRISPDPIWIAAQNNGSMAVFVPVAAIMGVLTIINTYVAQNLGAGKPERGSAYAWNGLWIAVVAWLALLPYTALLPAIFRWAGHADPPNDPRLIGLELEYGQVLLYGCVLTMATRGIAQYFYGMHRPMTVLIAALAGNLTNCALNLLLIFGDGPMPADFSVFGSAASSVAQALDIPPLGLAGAAIATLIGLGVEFAIPFMVFLSPGMNAKYRTRAAWRPSIPHMKDLARLGWPGGLMFGNEMICWAYFTVVLVAQFGTAHQTAGYIALQWMHMSFMPAVGISVAITAIVGRCMGMNRPDLAARRTWLGLAITLVYMGGCALAFVLLRGPMIGMFAPDDMPPQTRAELIRIGSLVMIAAATFQLFDATAIAANGALRGAGDTVWPGVATLVLSWLFVVGGGRLAVEYLPTWESLGPWAAASLYVIVLGLAFFIRFLGGRWRTRRVLHDSATSPSH